ncbi:DUF6443 domain-containing protein [uncultured Dysgonomonas sp.]|uniref:DUF6443 domain-containing protein n=1 Tax=uncultured Dysgonomonas sp. TaxID=206096 RepID=A0A212JNR9_9BACT|nr:DUF6443 domain-containing protein [uncultured Dysgonomonas sp.]SBW01083.1 conserved exported hypothetical protein [uncultured Dysgonomonas sp.]
MKKIILIYLFCSCTFALYANRPYAGPTPETIGQYVSGDSINIQRSYTSSPGVSSFRFILTKAATVDIMLTVQTNSSTSNTKIQGIWKGVSMNEDYYDVSSDRTVLSLDAGVYVFLCFTTESKMNIELMFFDPYTIETDIDKVKPYAGPIPEYQGEKKSLDIIKYNKTFSSTPNATSIEFTLTQPSVVDIKLTGSTNGCRIDYIWKGVFSTDASYSINAKRTRLSLGVGVYVILFATTADLSINADISFYKTSATSPDIPPEVNPEIRPEADITSSGNYIYTRSYRADDQSVWLDNYQYFDGLGRPIQNVDVGIIPDKSGDLVTLQEYDAFGRESKSWLPAVVKGNNGAYVATNTVRDKAFTTYNDLAYASSILESSPESRVTQGYGPGQDWIDNKKGKKVQYLTNSSGNGVLACYSVVMTTPLTVNGYVQPGQLFVIKTLDEDENCVYEFKNGKGQTILLRQMNGSEKNDTYLVYDAIGNLCTVIPPMASNEIGTGNWTSAIDKYGYSYKYDAKNRCIAKKLPGCDWIYYVYDKADRLIFTQDGEQRAKTTKEWTFNKYDALGRLIISGIYKTNSTHDAMQSTYSTMVFTESYGTGNYGYTWNILASIPVDDVLLINYYDDYEAMLKTNSYYKTNLDYNAESGYGTRHSSAKGLLVGTRVKLIDSNGKSVNTTEGQIITAIYYDNRGRLIQTKSTNHLSGGLEKEYLAYNFTGQPTKRKHVHSATGKTTQTEIYSYTYDHAGRLTKTTHQLNAGTVITLASNTYDELGRLNTNQKHTHANLKTTYAYNVRSWTKSITNTLFTENLAYNSGGNINQMQWVQAGKTRKYNFTYDNLSRLKTATYTGDGNFNTAYTYDKHGNIKTLQRYGLTASATYGIIDNLTAEHTGNQLKYITDAGPNVTMSASMDFKDYAKGTGVEYTYNANGAMSKDLNKGISAITYNSLNLPRIVDIKNMNAEGRNEYTYSASGQKLKAVQKWNPNYSTAPVIGSGITVNALTQTHTTDYVGNIIYENGVLKRILVDGGYNEGGNYYFYINDHLGNNRVVANAAASVVQSTQYYPFGMPFADGTGQNAQPYKYNNKELDSRNGLNMYDYSARYMDFSFPHFPMVDPLAEKYYSWSPYAYVMNNPLKYVDPDGKSTRVKKLEDGTYEIIGGNLDDDDKNIYEYTQDKNGDYTIQGNSIGITTSLTSFYDSYANNGEGAWAMGSIINPNDNNGDIFLQGLMDDNPSLVGYMWNATGGEKYDFKRTNNTEEVVYAKPQDWYRGMPITNTEFTVSNGPVFTSAKDVGNIAAGYVAAIKGLSWGQARKGFDGLQKLQDVSIYSVEKPSSVNAQQYGFTRGQRRLIINSFSK